MIKLRPYQEKFISDIRAAWEKFDAVLAVLPTGAGKTVCFAKLIHDHNGHAAAVVHRKEIVSQISCSLAQLGVKHRVVAPFLTVGLIRVKHLFKFKKSYIDPTAQTGVISVQTLTSKTSAKDKMLQAWLYQVTLSVYDEGHHYVKTGLWAKAVEVMVNAKLLFVTATPERADGKGLGAHADGFAEVLVEGPTTQWLIDEGWLSPFKYCAPKSDINLDNLPITASGEVSAKAMRERIVESHFVGDIVDHYLRFANGLSAITFCPDVITSEEQCAAFRAAGVTSEALSGKTDQSFRDKVLGLFEAGSLRNLLNVDLFDEGFDVPAVVAAILGRKTESLAKFLQMCGRALRPVYADGFDLSTAAGRKQAIAAGSKPVAIIIDPVRNWERHGMPNWPRAWTLDGREAGTRSGKSDTVPQRICDACTQPYEAFYKVCPHCGEPHSPPFRSTPEQVAGDLMELDVEAMAALFKKMQDVDMSDEDYALDQARRNLPMMARSKDMKRHRSGKYRRDILRNLIGWWVGAQLDKRDMSEIHSRFYFRFGVDIGTAHTLDAKESDALAERITANFSKDVAA